MRLFLVRHWFLLFIALGVGSTLCFPGPMHAVTDYFEPRFAVGASLFLMAWTMPTRSLVVELRSPWASLWAVFLSYGLVPPAGWLLGYLTPYKDVQVGLLLVASVPCTLSSAILWTRMAGANEATALLTVIGTTFSSWLLTTAWLYFLTGASIVNPLGIAWDLTVSLSVPVIVGQLLRLVRPVERFAENYKLWIGIAAQGLVLGVILKAGVTVGDRMHEQSVWNAPALVGASVLLALSLHLLALLGGFVSCRWLGFERGRQIAVAFSASQKTLQVSLLLYEQYFKTTYPFAVMPLLFYHVGQLLLDTLIAKQIMRDSSSETQAASEIYDFHI